MSNHESRYTTNREYAFDKLAQSLVSDNLSRQQALRLVGGALLGGVLGLLGSESAYATHFECRHVGARCKRRSQCCSGRCRNGRCRAHNTGTCPTQQDFCATATNCTPEGGTTACKCFQTTGGARYCGGQYVCFACTEDTFCEEQLGPGAACVVNCPGSFCRGQGQTSAAHCMGPCPAD